MLQTICVCLPEISAAGLTCAAVRYDAIHTQPRLGLKALDEMYHSAKKLAEVVCPSEYGLTRTQRLDIGSTICRNLVEKISLDIRGSVTSYMPKNQKEESSESDDDQVNIRLNPDYLDQEHFVDEEDFIENSIKTRLYFTSESHLHSVVNAMRYINVAGVAGQGRSNSKRRFAPELFAPEEHRIFDRMPEFDYLTQIVFKVYEDAKASTHDANRFFVKIGISPGVTGNAMEEGKQHLDCQSLIWFPLNNRRITYQHFVKALKNISEHVERQRSDFLEREASGKGLQETPEQRANRLASELIREEADKATREQLKQKQRGEKEKGETSRDLEDAVLSLALNPSVSGMMEELDQMVKSSIPEETEEEANDAGAKGGSGTHPMDKQDSFVQEEDGKKKKKRKEKEAREGTGSKAEKQ